MDRRFWLVPALATALAVPVAGVAAESTTTSDPGAASAVAIAETPSALALPIGSTVPPTLAVATEFAAQQSPTVATNWYTIRHRPRHRVREREREREREYDRRSSTSGFSQLHGGFLDPDGDQSPGFVLGFRGGTSIEDKIQVGLGLDWAHKSERSSVLISDTSLPGGGTSERRLELARSSSNLFPVMAFLQVSPAGDMPLVPYFGIAGGYELLFLSADDFETGEEFDATFRGWGWQAWAGAKFPLSGRTNLAVEVFRNMADLDRDVDDPTTGQTYREVVNLDGTGMRFGLNWGF